MMNRLQTSTLGELNTSVHRSRYDRTQLRPGIVHLGLGAFHRAHQAVYTEDAIAASGGDWGIIGVSMRSADVARQLQPQQGLYSVLSEDAGSSQLRVIAAIVEVLVAPDQPEAVVAAIARQDIGIVTLTITEKGYALAADGRSLDTRAAGMAHDLANPEQPRTALGLLALGLRQRIASGGAPLTLISCDNLSGNSAVLRAVLVDYLCASFPDVVPWLDAATAFPCSMVDRIVPAMTPARRQHQSQLLGLQDEGAVSTEPFTQWIIEDNFATDRPDWISAGAQLVDDIAPFEIIKLRLLNATHSAIAYCGLLADVATVDGVMADPVLGAFVARLMSEELLPALTVPAGFDLDTYRDQLLARFRNPCLAHRCAQIAMDGSEKISQRWLPTLQTGGAQVRLVRALSAWVYFILRTTHQINDPQSERLLQLRNGAGPVDERIAAVLACARISPASVKGFESLCEDVGRQLDLIDEKGIRDLVAM